MMYGKVSRCQLSVSAMVIKAHSAEFPHPSQSHCPLLRLPPQHTRLPESSTAFSLSFLCVLAASVVKRGEHVNMSSFSPPLILQRAKSGGAAAPSRIIGSVEDSVRALILTRHRGGHIVSGGSAKHLKPLSRLFYYCT